MCESKLPDYFLQKHCPSLFRSRAWLQAWKQTWGSSSKIQRISSADHSSLADSVYCYQQVLKKIIPVKTAFPLGISTSAAPSLRSEYFTLFDNNSGQLILDDYINTISTLSWSQFYIPDVLTESAEWFGFKHATESKGWMFVVKNSAQVYGVDLGGGNFSDYVKGLGSNTRLKLFNRRKNLEALGKVDIKNIWPNKELFFSLINDFHAVRWGKPCYDGMNAKFIAQLLDELAVDGHVIDLSVMTLNEQPISVVLDISMNGRTYNLQAGYLEQFSKNISLGTLHLGYQIEKAFIADGIGFYDFMAGTGKNANYKTALANKTAEFNTLLLVRSPLVKLLYKLQRYFAKPSPIKEYGE